MTDTTYILILPVSENYDSRKICERIEGETFTNHKKLTEALQSKGVHDLDEVQWLRLTDFMDAVNDGELDVLTESFISYITILGEK